MEINREYLQSLFKNCQLEITDEIFSKLLSYANLLVEWNEKINLTAITDADGIALKHFYDSVYPFTLCDIPQNARLIDVGTGAGFPSCPLKIFRNDIDLCLLDSLNKRIKFLEIISAECSLDAKCVHSRAEDGGKNPSLREQFDIATARAVAPLYILAEYCLPFVKVGGKFIALKGSSGMEELAESEKNIALLGGRIEYSKEYTLPNGDSRTLICIEKIHHTKAKYPRMKSKIVRI